MRRCICILISTNCESIEVISKFCRFEYFDFLSREGVVEYLTTEISTSKENKFSLVTFVDTPGLVDGDMIYAFNVDDTILWLGNKYLSFFGAFSFANRRLLQEMLPT